MVRRTLLIAMITACSWIVASDDAYAQRSNRSVSRPSMSTYNQFFRSREMGSTDPYNMMRYFTPQERPARRDVTSGSAGTTTTQLPTTELLRARARGQQQGQAGAIAPTGINSTFMNMSHYYQTPRFRR